MNVTPLATINNFGWSFKSSKNDKDNCVIVLAHHKILNNAYLKSFKNEYDSSVWCEMLVESTRMIFEDSNATSQVI